MDTTHLRLHTGFRIGPVDPRGFAELTVSAGAASLVLEPLSVTALTLELA